MEHTFQTGEQLDKIIHDEKSNSQYFDLSHGLVSGCHLLYYSSNDYLEDKDIIIFNFHHTLFDFPSMNIFLNDLDQAYSTGYIELS